MLEVMRMTHAASTFLRASVLLAACPASAATESPSEILVIQGGQVIDGTGRDPMLNASIVIEGERIKLTTRKSSY